MNQVEPIREYDASGNEIYFRNSEGVEVWRKFDANGKIVHSRHSYGVECWYEYDANGKPTYCRNSYGDEYWYYEREWTKDPIKILLLKAKLRDRASSI